MNEATAGQASMKDMAAREQYWEECNIEAKLERLRESIARLCRDMTTLSQAVHRLANHSHGDTGLLVPIHLTDPNVNYPGSGGLASGLYAHDNGIPHSLRTKRERGY